MATKSTNPNQDGRSTIQLELRLPNNKIIPFTAMNLEHISSTMAESLKQHGTHNLVVRAPSTEFVDNIVRFAQSKGTPRIRFRLGLGLPGQAAFLPWQEYLIVDFSASLEGLGKSAGHY